MYFITRFSTPWLVVFYLLVLRREDPINTLDVSSPSHLKHRQHPNYPERRRVHLTQTCSINVNIRHDANKIKTVIFRIV